MGGSDLSETKRRVGVVKILTVACNLEMPSSLRVLNQ